jgi:hypothetical protein
VFTTSDRQENDNAPCPPGAGQTTPRDNPFWRRVNLQWRPTYTGRSVRHKVLLSCRNHPHGQPSSCKLMSFLVLFTILSICSQFVLDSFYLFSICYQFFHFVFNFLNLFSILSICSQFCQFVLNSFNRSQFSQVVLIVSCHSHATEHCPFKLFLVLVSF